MTEKEIIQTLERLSGRFQNAALHGAREYGAGENGYKLVVDNVLPERKRPIVIKVVESILKRSVQTGEVVFIKP